MAKHKRMGTHKSLRAFLRALPSFCYQTSFEILTLAEQDDENILPHVLFIELCKLARAGEIERTPIRYATGGRHVMAYKHKGKD